MIIKDLKKIKVLFVCMGNICRSPTAHGVFQQLISQNGLSDAVAVDSAGTHARHIGKMPDIRAINAAARRKYDLSRLRTRKVTVADYEDFDYILVMDKENHTDMLSICGKEDKHKIKLFLEFATRTTMREVPDPYYGGLRGFETVLDLIEDASWGLLEHIKFTHLPNSE